jgi:RsiW-degrading membrane proteinase PrsW (M82 family)
MTDLATELLDFLAIFVIALVPAVLYLVWIRGIERYRTIGWGPIVSAFAYGAVIATLVAAAIEALLVAGGTSLSQAIPGPAFSFLNGNSTAGTFFLILVIAPFVEEGLKALGVVGQRARIQILADGPVFGASVGLGFGFFETALYAIVGFAVGGLPAAIAVILVRSVSSVLLHASSTAMFGYGYAQSRVRGVPGASGRYYFVAVGMHATYNALASLGVILLAFGVSNTIGALAGDVALVAAIAFAVLAFQHIARLIRETDFPVLAGARQFQPGTVRPRPPA